MPQGARLLMLVFPEPILVASNGREIQFSFEVRA